MTMEDYYLIFLVIVIVLSIPLWLIFLTYKGIRFLLGKRYGMAFGYLIIPLGVGSCVSPMLMPSYVHPMEQSRRNYCRESLRKMVAFRLNDYEGLYPATFDEMIGGELNIHQFLHPASHHEIGSRTNIHEWADYGYVTGLTESDPSNCVRVFCIPNNHGGQGANVAFNDKHVQWVPCKPCKDAAGNIQLTFQDLTNTPSLFYGTKDVEKLADLMNRTKIIYPKKNIR